MKKLILTATAIALIPVSANAQLLGGGGGLGGLGGGIGGSLSGTINSTIGSSIDRTTRSVRSTVDNTVRADGSTEGSQSVDARNGTVSADRSANGSLTGSTASLADLPVPALGGMANGSASGEASGQGSANADLLGTNDVTSAVAPITGQAREVAGQARNTARGAANQATGTAQSALANLPSAPTPGLPSLGSVSGSGSAEGNGAASLTSTPLAVAGSLASAANAVGTVSPGMPVMTPEGASLGKVEQIVANGRGEVEQLIVTQGDVTRTLPAGMFTATGNALIAGNAEGQAAADAPTEPTQPATEEAN